ncbi:MAG: glycosyltransferase [Bacteroidota bacterium]
MPKVSIITPVYNRPDFLKEAVESIQKQSFADWEHIIIDDGSDNPGTQKALQEISQKPKVSIFRTENRGLGAARNFGILKSSGDYIVTLDDDDIWHMDFIMKALSVFDSNKKVGAVSSWMQCFGAYKSLKKPEGGGIKNFLVHNNCAHAMFRKDCWELCGKYEENKFFQPYTDWDLWLRITARGYSVSIIPEVLFFYRVHEQSSMLKDAEEKHIELFRFLIEKNKDIYKANLADALCILEKKLVDTRKGLTFRNYISSKIKKILKGN